MAEYDKRIPEKLQLLRVGLGGEDDLGIFAYYPSARQTNFAVPSFCLAPATDAPDTMDIHGAIEETMHDLLNYGATADDLWQIMGLTQEAELDSDYRDTGEFISVDLGYCIEGDLLGFERLDPETTDVHDLLSEQQIVNVVMAFNNLYSGDALGAAERFAAGDYTCWQAQEVCKAYQSHLPEQAIDAIANPKLKPSEMRSLIGIAMVTQPAPDNGLPMRRALAAVLPQFDKVVPKLHLIESLAVAAQRNAVPFDERWCALTPEQVVSLRGAICGHVPAEVLEAFAGGRYPAANMDCITTAYCGGNGRMDASALLNPAYTPAQLWCLSSAVAAHINGDISDAQLDFLCNPTFRADLMNAVRNCFTYYGLTIEQAEQHIDMGTTPEEVYDLLDADADIERPSTEEKASEQRAEAALSEEARAAREASGHLEADMPKVREEINQEKE